MKKILLALACAAFFTACNGKPEEPTLLDVSGSWELSSVATKAKVGSETVSVYLTFETAGDFSIYQKIGAGRYTHFTGTYKLDQDNKTLSGSYSGGSAWGPYEVEISGSDLLLTSPNGGEVDTYKKIDAVPDSVTANTY